MCVAAGIDVVRMAQFVLKIEKLSISSYIIGEHGSQGLWSPSPIMAPAWSDLVNWSRGVAVSNKDRRSPGVPNDVYSLSFLVVSLTNLCVPRARFASFACVNRGVVNKSSQLLSHRLLKRV